MVEAAGFHLAQFNTARALAPLDHPRLADFVAALDEVNTAAETAPGFVWRLADDSGNATGIRPFQDPEMLVNLSLWESVDALFDFTYRSVHRLVLRRRKEWFEYVDGPHLVFWWVPAGHRPDVAEAMERLDHLRKHGATPHAFGFKEPFPAPDAADAAGATVAPMAPMAEGK